MALLRLKKVYEAHQFTGILDAPGWPDDFLPEGSGTVSEDGAVAYVRSKDGVHSVRVGDWIVKDKEDGSMNVASDKAIRSLYETLGGK